jgi:enoyl-CoA hydratase/carnithine racemase
MENDVNSSTLSTPDIGVAVEDGVATVTMRRPDRMNALHPAAHHAMERALDALEVDTDTRAVVLTGAGGKAFCAGYDLRDSIETGVMELAEKGFGGLTLRSFYGKPIIAAVDGIAMGGGFEMALACDMIVASSTARFALPEVKVGWAALGGGVQRLPRAIGIKRAMDIMLTGRTVDADEALALGLVSEITEPGKAAEAAQRWARQIAENAPLAIACTRRIAYAALDQAYPGERLDLSQDDQVNAMLESEDSVEGRTAFLEKRAPAFNGR